jgi:hypothetical protein
MLPKCTTNVSLPKSGKNKIISDAEQHIVNNEFYGPDLFKLIMNKAIIDIRVTSTTLLSNLMNQDDCMSTCNSNIDFLTNMLSLIMRV